MSRGRVERWEKPLRALFEDIDVTLELEYGHTFPLHPARPAHGTTARRTHDGLFNIGARFTPGYGSEHGRGYVVEVEMRTLASIPGEMRSMIESRVAAMVSERLPQVFPGRDLRVLRDGPIFKIVGDLSLGH